MNLRPHGTALPYGVAVASVLIALAASLLWRAFFERNPFLLFFAAVAVAAWYGGLMPGLLATLLSALAASFFLLEPASSLALSSTDLLHVGGFALVAIVIAALFERTRDAKHSRSAEGDELATILAAVTEGVTVQQAGTGKLLYANDMAAQLSGYPSTAALLAAPLAETLQKFEIKDEDGNPLPLTELPGRLALAGERTPERIVRFANRATGEERWSLVRARPLFDERGQVRAAVSTFHDITPLKRSEQSLAEQREWLQVTLASIGDAVIAADLEGCVRFINPIAQQLTGWTREEALGRPMAEILKLINEQTREPLNNPIERVLSDNVTVGLANHSLLIAKDGTEHPIDDSAAPIRDREGAVVGAVLVFRDVSERRRHDEALTSLTERLQAIIDASPDAIYVLDREGTVTLWTPASERLYGFTAAEVVGKALPTVREAEAEDLRQARESILRDGKPVLNRESFRYRKDGQRLITSFSMAPLRGPNGDITEFVTISADITARRQAEDALRASNEQISEILESMTEAFYALDRDWRFTYVNRHAAELWGKDRDELLGRVIWEVLPQAVGTHAYDAHVKAMNERVPVSYEAVSPVLRYWVSVNMYPTPFGISVYFRDIEERKRAEISQQFLARASEILASSLDYETTLAAVAGLTTPHIADWCAIDVLNEDEEIKRVAVAHVDPKKVEWAYDLQRRFPMNMNAPAGVPNVLRTGQPEFIPKVTEEMIAAAALTDEERKIIDEIGFRSVMTVPLTARGRTFGAITLVSTAESERYFDERDLNLAQELARRAAIAVDNARLYREAQAQRQQLQVTLESIGDAVIVTDAEGRVNFMNAIAEQLTGWSMTEATGERLERIFTIVNEDTRAVVENPVTKVIRQGAIVGLANHTLLISRDGTEIPIDDSGAPIRDASGAIIGVVLVFRDISERRAVERERAEVLRREQSARRAAEEANELKLRFLAMISHELRTPLTSIKGFTSTMLATDVEWDPALQHEFVQIMDQEADKLADLVEQLLDVSRLQAGTLRISPEKQTLDSVIDSAMAQMQAVTAEHDFQLDIPDDLPPVLIDEQRIAQVLVNLVGNAAKYSPPQSRIAVTARQAGDVVEVEVDDEGEGIPPEHRPYVFETFRQIDRSAVGRQKGAGLGLAICKGLVEAHGGEIWIKDRPGPGTTIAFTIPIAQP